MLSVILIIGGVTVAVGLLCYSHEILQRKKHHHNVSDEGNEGGSVSSAADDNSASGSNEEVCCGLHAVCEKMYGKPGQETPEYYDDEELDLLADRNPETFSNEERENLREVMMTLLPADRPGWAKSLEMRRIKLPDDLRDELLMLIAEI